MTEKMKNYSSAETKKLERSLVEITASIPTEIWSQYRQQAVKNIGTSVSIDGFRKGNIPENILIAKVGEMPILEEMAELAIPKAYVSILIDKNIDAIGKPSIQVTKLAVGNPLEFKALTAVVPEITLPDYKTLAKAESAKIDPEAETVSDKEFEEALLKVRKAHSPAPAPSPEATAEKAPTDKKDIEADLPELTDELAKEIGGFNTVDELKSKLKEALLEEKKSLAREKLRIKIADAIAEKTTSDIPDVMIDSELSRTQAQFEADIERMGVKLDDYLKYSKKNLEDLRKEWRPHAEKKAKLQLILNSIAKAENIVPDKSEIEAEVARITAQYSDADRERAAVYAETVLTNEKVFKFLEA